MALEKTLLIDIFCDLLLLCTFRKKPFYDFLIITATIYFCHQLTFALLEWSTSSAWSPSVVVLFHIQLIVNRFLHSIILPEMVVSSRSSRDFLFLCPLYLLEGHIIVKVNVKSFGNLKESLRVFLQKFFEILRISLTF